MKKFLYAIAAFVPLFACTPINSDDQNNDDQNNLEELTITGEALDITAHSATLTGFANLPFELGDAEVGVLYDNTKTFRAARKAVANGLDGNNMFSVTAIGLKASTTYYYKSYVQNGMAMKYGAVKSFTTIAQQVTSISLDRISLSMEIGEEATLTVTSVQPYNAKDKSYTWSSSDNAIASVNNTGKVKAKSKGTATIKATANDGSGVSAACEVGVYRIDVPQAVDMGIVVNGNNIKWASFNLGASSPEEYGLYYAWGETAMKDNYEWSTYKWCNGLYEIITKYNTRSGFGTVDNKTVLDSKDDVAHVKLGGKWRMPTDAEWTALREQCTCKWTTQNGVNGILVTASNGNNIFLPAAGYRYIIGLAHSEFGFYWSSSLDTDRPHEAWYVYVSPSSVHRGHGNRYPGFSVRPVSE